MEFTCRSHQLNKEPKNTSVFFILVSVLLNSGSALMTTEHSSLPMMMLILTFSYVFFVVLSSIIKKKRIGISPATIFMVLFTLSFILSVIQNYSVDNLSTSFRTLLLIYTAYLLTSAIDIDKFFGLFVQIMRSLTLISLVSWVLFNVIGPEVLPTLINKNGVLYYNGILFFFMKNEVGLLRNMSIFWEPGIFASILIFTLILETFFNKKPENRVNVLIFTVAVITTQSSAGYILLLFYYLLRMLLGNSYKRLLIVLTLFSMIIYIYFNYDTITKWLLTINYPVFSKFFDSERDTTGTRLFSPYLNILVFLKSPLFGVGMYDVNVLYSELMISTYNEFKVVAQTATSFLFLAALGLPGAIYTLGWIKGISKLKRYSVILRIMLLILFLLIINKEPHTHFLITYCLMFYLQKNNECREKTNES